MSERINGNWVNQDEQKPPIGKEVAICIIRRAVQVENGDGSTSWQLAKDLPIELDKDTFFWQETDLQSIG